MKAEPNRPSQMPAALFAGGLLLAFGVLSYSAVLTKCATADEPVHLTAAYTGRFLGDYRVNPEHPTLWKFWASLFLSPDDLRVDTTSTRVMNRYGRMVNTPWPGTLDQDISQFDLANDALYGPRHANTDKALALGRLAMLMLGLALGAFTAAWAGWLGGCKYGTVAGVIAAALFASDPNMLAHASLVTNDIAFALCFALVAWTIWLAGRKLSLMRGLGLAFACAAAVNVKYSALICGPLVALMLMIRALLPASWPTIGGFILRRWPSRLAAAVLLGLACAAVTVGVTWAAYGFRFAVGRDGETFNTDEMLRAIRWRDLGIPHRHEPLRLEQVPARVRAIVWIERHRLLPQAYTFGLLRFEKDAVRRNSYLCGEIRTTGWWYYYPAAMIFKTPLGTLGLAALAVVGAAMYVIARRKRQGENKTPSPTSPNHLVTKSPSHLVTLPSCHPPWTSACLLLPPAAYLAVGMASAFNIGIRHIFPVYPFLFIGLSLPLAWLWQRERRWGRIALLILLAGSVVEVVRGYPNYIAFFNQACGGWRGGGTYLTDSNLDWGQDLPLLAEWQSRHPGETVYLGYFGHADPQYHGVVRYVALPSESVYPWARGRVKELRYDDPPPAESGWLALSANIATGTLLVEQDERDYYRKLGDLRNPDEILGGSIYLYRWKQHK